MQLESISLVPADPTRHYAAIAALISTQETEPTTPESLAEWYSKQQEDGIWFTAAVAGEDHVLGFSGLYVANKTRQRYYDIYLIVDEKWRRCGLGSMLYDHLLVQAQTVEAKTLVARIRDTCTDGIRFAVQKGFSEKKHSVEMQLDLRTWNESAYEPIWQALEAQGFQFTNMAQLGDGEDARRKLFELNNGAAATDPGSDGIPPWATFEEFNRDVCISSWYHPDAQIVAIDTHNGKWAAMSAITVFAGADHAYNLFTGTDVNYRGRKLAQAVKALALRRARQFGVDSVRTSHNSENEVMIAIDNKLGYVRTPGSSVMEKEL